jgi:lon-related putative ATP-dependent protease
MMTTPKPLSATALYRACDPEALRFASSEELADLEGVVGQERAMAALRTGVELRHSGFNVFALVPEGTGCRSVVESFVRARAATEAKPPDCSYVVNFHRPREPRLLHLPAGVGARLQADLDALAAELRNAIPAAFESEEYRQQVRRAEQALAQQQGTALEKVQQEAAAADVQLVPTPPGFTFVPLRRGKSMERSEFDGLPEPERRRIEATIDRLQERLHGVLGEFRSWHRDLQKSLHELNESMVLSVVDQHLEDLRASFSGCEAALGHLEAIRSDVKQHVDVFLRHDEEEGGPERVLSRYRVNLLVDNSRGSGAPVVIEDEPSVPHLVGRIEHSVQQGTLVTDFSLIRAGSLHRANGGYLIVEARKLLMQPFAWDTLKQALSKGEVKVESLEQKFSLISTITLEPEPLPLELKVVLVGSPMLYYLLVALDPDFVRLFKVQADFADQMSRNADSELLYARLLATLARRRMLRPLERDAVARIIEHASRLTNDSERLSAELHSVMDLLLEAEYLAQCDAQPRILAGHVEQALAQRRHRASQLEEQLGEAAARGTLHLATEGMVVGQVNGLSVIDLGNHRFGRTVRITATARMGSGRVIDIEREAKLGGAIHSKAVLILSSFLGARYAGESPLALSASIAFEQSYGPVEGDSASVAETCALLSAIGEVPLSQALAVTGSIGQHGEVLAVGGINEKIEGFFELCRQRGHSSEVHGVIIPRANLAHLMLAEQVRVAVREGTFRIYAIEVVDQALALLSGLAADDEGESEQSFAAHIRQRLERFAAVSREQQPSRGTD